MVPALSQLDASTLTLALRTAPVFVGDERNDQIQRWGPVFAVFGEELAAVLAGLKVALLGADEISEQVSSATRRYGALLTTMCSATVASDNTMVVYDCCDGFTVLLMRKNDGENPVSHKPLSSLDEESLWVDERVFKEILARAIRLFFLKFVSEMTGIVTVSVDERDYLFLRTEVRETILDSLHVGVDVELA